MKNPSADVFVNPIVKSFIAPNWSWPHYRRKPLAGIATAIRVLLPRMSQMGRARAALLLSVIALVGCDRASKLVAEATLRDHASVVVITGVIDLDYVENRDVAFNAMSRLSLHPPAWTLTLLTVMTMAMVLGAWARRRRVGWREQAAFALVSAGALGNALDRLLHGRVVDFIHVRFWPIFNVADALIVAGAALFWLNAGARSRGPGSSSPQAPIPS